MGSNWAGRVRAGIVGWICGAIALGTSAAQAAPRPDPRDERDSRPYAVVDKRLATLSVYAADGRLVGRAPALLGLTPGDQEAPGSRGKAPEALKAHERVTPAGRYEAQPGHNLHGDRIVWIDYEASLAIHRLRPAPARERRPQRLASADPREHRITLGCVVVDPTFFDRVVLPTLGQGSALVYILPEREPLLAAGTPQGAAAP